MTSKNVNIEDIYDKNTEFFFVNNGGNNNNKGNYVNLLNNTTLMLVMTLFYKKVKGKGKVVNLYSLGALENDLYFGTLYIQLFYKKKSIINQDGGKIGEKAKASSNVDDSGKKRNGLKTSTHVLLSRSTPNSPLLNLNSKFPRIHVNYTRDALTIK